MQCIEIMEKTVAGKKNRSTASATIGSTAQAVDAAIQAFYLLKFGGNIMAARALERSAHAMLHNQTLALGQAQTEVI